MEQVHIVRTKEDDDHDQKGSSGASSAQAQEFLDVEATFLYS
jgi:hypothetical protein